MPDAALAFFKSELRCKMFYGNRFDKQRYRFSVCVFPGWLQNKKKKWPKWPNLTVFPEILSILKLVVFTTASSGSHIALPYGVTALHTASLVHKCAICCCFFPNPSKFPKDRLKFNRHFMGTHNAVNTINRRRHSQSIGHGSKHWLSHRLDKKPLPDDV